MEITKNTLKWMYSILRCFELLKFFVAFVEEVLGGAYQQ